MKEKGQSLNVESIVEVRTVSWIHSQREDQDHLPSLPSLTCHPCTTVTGHPCPGLPCHKQGITSQKSTYYLSLWMKRITSKIDLLENLFNFGRKKESMATSEDYYNTPDSPRNQGKTQGNLTINSHLPPPPPPPITKLLPSPRPVRRNTLEEI